MICIKSLWIDSDWQRSQLYFFIFILSSFQPNHFPPFQATKNSNNSSSSSLSSVADLCDNSVLNYRTSSRIHDYLNSLSQIQQQAKLRYDLNI